MFGTLKFLFLFLLLAAITFQSTCWLQLTVVSSKQDVYLATGPVEHVSWCLQKQVLELLEVWLCRNICDVINSQCLDRVCLTVVANLKLVEGGVLSARRVTRRLQGVVHRFALIASSLRVLCVIREPLAQASNRTRAEVFLSGMISS